VNGVESPITFVVAATGAINYSLANVSMGGVTLSLSPSTSNGSATVTVTLPSITSSGSFDFIASPTGGTAWTVSVTHIRETLGLGSMYRLIMANSSESSNTAACSASIGTTYAFYATTANNNIGGTLYASDEAARSGVGDQGLVFVGDGNWYLTQQQYFNGVAYIDISSTKTAYQISSSGQITGKYTCP
jgi:hypothetical protein